MIFIPLFIVVAYLFTKWYKHSRKLASSFDEEYNRYLIRLGNKNFFCYNNNSRSQAYIEEFILPQLPEQVAIIFLNGRAPQSDYPEAVASALLWRVKNFEGFPHLIKLNEGNTEEKSLNNLVYNCINQQKDSILIINVVRDFFELPASKSHFNA